MTVETASQAKNKSTRRRFDVIGWLGIVIGLSGLVTGYIHYLWAITYPEISWWSTNQVVFNARNSNSDIRLVDRTGAQIEHDVYALNTSVSNTGNALLEHMNDVGSLVRSPLTITLPTSVRGEGRIVSAAIVNVSKRQPVDLACKLLMSRVEVSWSHLDPGVGFNVLILYVAQNQITPDVDIDIVGMRGPTQVFLAPRLVEVSKIPWWNDILLAGAIPMSLVVLVGLCEFISSYFSIALMKVCAGMVSVAGASLILIFILFNNALIGFWHRNFPATEPPLAIATPITNLPCVSDQG